MSFSNRGFGRCISIKQNIARFRKLVRPSSVCSHVLAGLCVSLPHCWYPLVRYVQLVSQLCLLSEINGAQFPRLQN